MQTRHSTAFFPVRQALRTLFSDKDDGWRRAQVWNEESMDGWENDEPWPGEALDPGHYAWWHGDETDETDDGDDDDGDDDDDDDDD